ncbi:hypothetical protein MIND_01103500 [Mycena indigotica]|uniref:Uncharacterized protein n=1 Tax=Mycena indigotica TaxID=2126181 RepID=A0A8H6SA28_9AGAR|nr:uncharacterized protein MIND_01103500 [Mycena indigotica]KAF7295633.1 hypothetical protein MIND_01103500 [Mycena indigotica]
MSHIHSTRQVDDDDKGELIPGQHRRPEPVQESSGHLNVEYDKRLPLILHYDKFCTDLVSTVDDALRYSSFECYIYGICQVIFNTFTLRYDDKSPNRETSVRCEQQYSFIKKYTQLPNDLVRRKYCTPDFACVRTDATPQRRLIFFAEIKALAASTEQEAVDAWFINPDMEAIQDKMQATLSQVANQLHFAKHFFGDVAASEGWHIFVVCGVFWSLHYIDSGTLLRSGYRAGEAAGPSTRSANGQANAKRSKPDTTATTVDLDTFDPALVTPISTNIIEPAQSFFDMTILQGRPTHGNCPLNPNLDAAFTRIINHYRFASWSDHFTPCNWFHPRAASEE